MKKVILFILAVLIISTASAHIPKLVLEDRNYTIEPIIVDGPEISWAYYGRLQGQPHVYEISMDEPFNLYVSLLVPYVGQENTSDVEFHIIKDGERIAMLHDYDNWTLFYEEYGRDWYLQGPKYEADVSGGTYYVEVHSDTNTEEYTLAIGKEEKWGGTEILRTMITLPFVKAIFFDKYLLLGIIGFVLAVIVGLVIFLYERQRK